MMFPAFGVPDAAARLAECCTECNMIASDICRTYPGGVFSLGRQLRTPADKEPAVERFRECRTAS